MDMNEVTIVTAPQAQTIEQELAWASLPFGDAASLRQREAGAQALLARGATAHQRIIDLLRTGHATNAPALVALLPRFGLEAAVPVLLDLLGQADTGLVEVAAQALAQHPSPQAPQALLQALASPHARTLIAAADALGARGSAEAGPRLRELRHHADAGVRFHALQAAHRLQALLPDDLVDAQSSDGDSAVRALAASLRAAAAPPGGRP